MEPAHIVAYRASLARRQANAWARSSAYVDHLRQMAAEGATIPDMQRELTRLGHRAARGGEITHNTVSRALARLDQPQPPPPATVSDPRRARRGSVRSQHARYEVFRTPLDVFLPLLDYRPEWFDGSGFDPSAGDGRMIREIVARGNTGPHRVNDIRPEEWGALSAIPHTTATIANYLELAEPPRADFMLTNAPFSLAQKFVIKARGHIRGPICVLQTVAWLTTLQRSRWFRQAGLSRVLLLPTRPKWEVDSGLNVPANIWHSAWYVFLPKHEGLPVMDWLVA